MNFLRTFHDLTDEKIIDGQNRSTSKIYKIYIKKKKKTMGVTKSIC